MLKTYLTTTLALVTAAHLSAQSPPLLELTFPYASEGWVEPQIMDITPKLVDFDGDGQADDWVVSRFCSTPPLPEYGSEENFTKAGPEFLMRASLAALDESGQPSLELGSHGVTSTTLRLEGTRKKEYLTGNMAYAGFWVIDHNSFSTGEMTEFKQGGSIQAKAATNMGDLTWHILIRRGKDFLISKTESTGTELSIPDLAAEVWQEYPQALQGRDLLFEAQAGKETRGEFIRFITGIGVYAYKKNFDGTAMAESDRIMLEISELTVHVNESYR